MSIESGTSLAGDAQSQVHRFERTLFAATRDGLPPGDEVDIDWSGDSLRPATATVIENLRPLPAFLLLGELGVGKTWLFENEAERLRAEGQKYVVSVRLGEFADLPDLERESFEHDDISQATANSEVAYLFLDSLDQGLIQIPQLHRWLLRRLQVTLRYPRIRVRISSRILPQAQAVAAGIAALHQMSQADLVFYVGALTKDEIAREARSRGVDSDKFLRAVAARNAEILATHPLTLDLLLGEYRRTRKLASDLVRLYRAACGVLTEEHETTQIIDAPIRGEPAYALTGRIAALMGFTGKPSISLAPTRSMPDASISPEIVVSVPESANGKSVEINYGQLRYVLTNAQFQVGGQDAYRWSHVSLQNFMGAEWAAQRLHPDQIQGLLVHPLDRRGQIRIDLEEMAAWLAGMIPAIRQYLVRVQPLVLLTSQSQAGARSDPADLLRTLLAPENAILVRWRNVRDVRLRRLNCPEAASILKPALSPTGDREVQWLALAIIRQSRIKGFDNELLELVTNPTVTEFVAVSAGIAIEQTGSPAVRRKVAELLLAAQPAELPDDVKAVLLRATWPRFTSATTLFRLLTPPRDEVIGLYDTLPAKWILDNLRREDLVPAMAWVASEPLSGYVPSNRGQLVAGIVRLAATHLDDGAIRSSMVELLQKVARSEIAYRELDALAPLYETPEVARLLLSAAILDAPNPLEFVRLIYWQLRGLIHSLGWLLSQRKNSVTAEQRDAWLWLIERTQPSTTAELNRLRTLARKDPLLQSIASTAVVAPRLTAARRSTPVVDHTRSISERADLASQRDRLLNALEQLDTHGQARLDVADLVWKPVGSSSALQSLWQDLEPEVRERIDAFFARQLSNR